MGNWRTYFLIYCFILTLISILASICHCQKLSEEEPVQGSGNYNGINEDDEDFPYEGSGRPVNHPKPVIKPIGRTSTPIIPALTSGSSNSINSYNGGYADITPGFSDNSHKSQVPSSTYIVVGIVASILLLAIAIVAISCCCRRSKNNDYTQGTTRSKSYV